MIETGTRNQLETTVKTHGRAMKKKENIDDFWKGGLLPNCGIDIIKYNPQTGEYTFAKEMEFYYETELFEKAPRLLK